MSQIWCIHGNSVLGCWDAETFLFSPLFICFSQVRDLVYTWQFGLGMLGCRDVFFWTVQARWPRYVHVSSSSYDWYPPPPHMHVSSSSSGHCTHIGHGICTFSKVLDIVTLPSKYTRALTFQNFCRASEWPGGFTEWASVVRGQ